MPSRNDGDKYTSIIGVSDTRESFGNEFMPAPYDGGNETRAVGMADNGMGVGSGTVHGAVAICCGGDDVASDRFAVCSACSVVAASAGRADDTPVTPLHVRDCRA
jgi:hypothetical protein